MGIGIPNTQITYITIHFTRQLTIPCHVFRKDKARRKKISAQELSERCGVSKRTVYYWLEEEYQLSAEAFVRIVVGLHLPPYISMRFMNVCGVMLQFYGVHMMYWKILNCFFMDTIYEVNRHMRDAGFPAMTEGIE